MHLKITFNKWPQRAFVPVLMAGALLSARAAAQLSEPGDAAPNGQAAAYRDGPNWISVERGRDGERATLRSGPYEFHARIDEHAIVQLDQGADPDAIWAREQLRDAKRLSRSLDMYRVTGRPGEDGLAIALRLSAAKGVREASPDLIVPRVKHEIEIPPNDEH